MLGGSFFEKGRAVLPVEFKVKNDAIAPLWLFEDDICTFRRGRVLVSLEEAWGRTDFIPAEDGNMLVADTIDREAFFRHYLETVAR